mgnify:CR=1 FL=1
MRRHPQGGLGLDLGVAVRSDAVQFVVLQVILVLVIFLAATGLRSIERPYLAPKYPERARMAGMDRWFLLRLEGAVDLPGLAERLRATGRTTAGFVSAFVLEPVQILWINLLDSVLLTMPLMMEAKEHDLLHQPPRDARAHIIDRAGLLGRRGGCLLNDLLVGYCPGQYCFCLLGKKRDGSNRSQSDADGLAMAIYAA